ncbi:hypothetical protein BDZ89DRAFT_381450 [Hymenopellis radicata]|nr:hypothetical protein BDZ89DRAFT_381450 [Hymenopellis radicata]
MLVVSEVPIWGHSFSRRSSPPSSKSSSPSSSKCNSPQSSMTSLSLDDLLPELDFQTADESSDEDEDESCLNLFLETFVSPAMRLSNGILDTNPEAHIAIVSDRMWMAHITSIPDGPRLVRKIMSERETIIHNGVAILQDTSVSGDSETVEKQQIGPLVGDVEGGNAGFSTNLPSSANLEKDHWETPSTCDFPPEIPFDGDRDKLCQDEFDPQDSQYYVTTRASFRASIKTDTLLRGPCTSGTRVETIDKIMSWARANDADAPSVFWLTGLAGTGKTTIAYTICERMWADSKDSQLIVPTICRNLAELFPSNATELVPVLQADSVLGEARIHEQIDDLLVAPWSASLPKRDGLPAPVVVIDALDENDNGVEFLKNLFRVVGDKRLTGIKFLVTRRPQPEIVDLCHSFQLLADMIYHLHEVPLVDVQDDIAKFLAEKLTELRDTNKRAQLTLRAGGLCLSAATVVRFISPLHRTLSQDEQREKLQKLLEPGGPSGSTLLVAQLCEQVLSAASFAPHPNTSRASYRKASSTPSPRSSRASSNNNLKAPEPFLSTASFAPHPNTSRASYRKSSSTPSPRSSRASSNNNLKTPDGSGAMGVFLYIGRKSWKTLRGGEMVWPAELEAALIEAGLEKYQPDDSRETRLLGRFPMRNRFISEYIYRKTGRRCTVKQVASRLQQLRETYTGKRLIDLLSPCRRQVPAPLTSSAYDSTSTIHYDSASSNRSGSVPITPTTLLQGHTNCITSVSFSDNGASSPPRWPKLNHGDVPYGVATAVQDILMVQVAPLSAIPKAVGAAVKAFATRYENTAAREELRDRIVEIEALGHFPYLQEPIHNFQQVFETTDSLLERLIHASSEDELLRTVDKKFDSGLAMQNLAQTLQSEQTLHDKMKSQTLIDESGTVIVRVVRGGGKFSGSGNHFALTCHPRECEVMAGPPRTST